jgi:hypothetical protein
LALVIGNSAYPGKLELQNPEHDASDMAAKFRQMGLTVIQQLNTDRVGLQDAVQSFAARVERYPLAIVYYAGHGIQIRGANYLVPVDADLGVAVSDPSALYPVSQLVEELQRIGSVPRTNLLILDACRSLLGTTSAPPGLARLDNTRNVFVAFATGYGQVAADGTGQRNSPYTKALLSHIGDAGRPLPEIFQRVRTDVEQATAGQQSPREDNGLVGYAMPVLVSNVPSASAFPAAPAPLLTLPRQLADIPDRSQRLEALRSRLAMSSYRKFEAADVVAILKVLDVGAHAAAMKLMVPQLKDGLSSGDTRQIVMALADDTTKYSVLLELAEAGKAPGRVDSQGFADIASALGGPMRAALVVGLLPRLSGPLAPADFFRTLSVPPTTLAHARELASLLSSAVQVVDPLMLRRLVTAFQQSPGTTPSLLERLVAASIQGIQGPFPVEVVGQILQLVGERSRWALLEEMTTARQVTFALSDAQRRELLAFLPNDLRSPMASATDAVKLRRLNLLLAETDPNPGARARAAAPNTIAVTIDLGGPGQGYRPKFSVANGFAVQVSTDGQSFGNLAQGAFLQLKSDPKLLIRLFEQDGDVVGVYDQTTTLRNALAESVRSRLSAPMGSGVNSEPCDIFGCDFGETFKSAICNDAVSDASISDTPNGDGVGLIGECRTSTRSGDLCYRVPHLPFAVAPGKPVFLRLSLVTGERIVQEIPVGNGERRPGLSLDGIAWLPLTPVDEVPGRPHPYAAIAYVAAPFTEPRFSLIVGVEGCASRGTTFTRADWRVDATGAGFVAQDPFANGPASLSIDYPGPKWSGVGPYPTSADIAVGVERKDTSWIGPFKYRFSPLAAVERAAAIEEPRLECWLSSPATMRRCQPERTLGWIRVKSVRIGPSAAELGAPTSVAFDVTAYMNSRTKPGAALPPLPMEDTWHQVFYQITLVDGRVLSIRAATLR